MTTTDVPEAKNKEINSTDIQNINIKGNHSLIAQSLYLYHLEKTVRDKNISTTQN